MTWNEKINDLNSLITGNTQSSKLSTEFMIDLSNELRERLANFQHENNLCRFVINYYLENYLIPELKDNLDELQEEGGKLVEEIQELDRRLINSQSLANEINFLIDNEKKKNLELEIQNEELTKRVNKQLRKIENLEKNNSSQEKKWTEEKEGNSETVEKLKTQIQKLVDSKIELKDKNKQLKEQVNEAEKTEQENDRTILNLKQKLKTQTKKIEELEEFGLLAVRDFDEEKKLWEAEKNQFIAEKEQLVYQLTLEENKRLNKSRSRSRSRSSSIYLETIDEKNASLSKEMSNRGYKAENGRFSSRHSSRATSPYSSPTSPVVDYFANGFLEQKEKRILELESLLESLEETNFSLEEDNFSLREELKKVQKGFEEKWEEENNRLLKENQRLIEEIDRQRQSNLSRFSSRLQLSLIDSTYYPPQGYMEKMPSFHEDGSSCPPNYDFNKLDGFNDLTTRMIEEGNETLVNNSQVIGNLPEKIDNNNPQDLVARDLRELNETQKRKIIELENTSEEETNRLRELLNETQKDLSIKTREINFYRTLQENYDSLRGKNDLLQKDYNSLLTCIADLNDFKSNLENQLDRTLKTHQELDNRYRKESQELGKIKWKLNNQKLEITQKLNNDFNLGMNQDEKDLSQAIQKLKELIASHLSTVPNEIVQKELEYTNKLLKEQRTSNTLLKNQITELTRKKQTVNPTKTEKFRPSHR